MLTRTLIETAATVFGSASLSLVLVWLTRSWISARLSHAISHEYSEKLERYKAQLESENNAALERLKGLNERQCSELKLAAETYREAHLQSLEKRIDSITLLWRAICLLNTKAPPILTYVDCLMSDELSKIRSSVRMKPSYESLTHDEIIRFTELNAVAIDEARLFAGDELYALVYAYRAFLGRICVSLVESHAREDILNQLFRDRHLRRLLGQVFSEPELTEWDCLKTGKLDWVRKHIEQRFIEKASPVLSGREAGSAAFDQSREIIRLSDRVYDQRGEPPALVRAVE